MAGQETWIAQLDAQVLNESEEILGNITMNGLHPQVNGGTAEPVQAKSLYNNILCLIQLQWGWGEGER
jgi:hypothetical protein